ncbi:MAG: Kelch repeat-containing protein [archaeon]
MNKGLLIVVLFFVHVFLSSPILVCRVCAIENSWEIMADIPYGRLNPGVATVNGKIYVIGGYHQGEVRFNQEYDPKTNTWKNKAPMPTKRSAFAIAVYENKIYCIGGGDDSYEGVTGITEVYDPLMDTWETKSPMPTAREFMDANVVDGKIYVIGGSNFPNLNDPYYVPNINEVYNPETDTWSTSVTPPVKVSNYASAVCDNKIYIFSEYLTQIFEPQINSWSNGTSMPNPGWGAAAGATTGEFAAKGIYVLGGNPTFNPNQIYNPETDSWSIGAAMPTNRYGLGVVIIDDVLYALGGPGASGMAANEKYTPSGYIPEFSSWAVFALVIGVPLVVICYKKKLSNMLVKTGV